ncbi:protein disulfide isomerase family protein [bacterium]|nr:protein disulfide isomerase family protein [bacterium]
MKFVSILNNGGEFDDLVKESPALVKFFHPDCGHCKDMAPHWDSLKDKLKDHHHKNINVIEVHADALPEIKSDCAKNIPGYPTIMEVKMDGKGGKEHKGERHADALHKFFLDTFINGMKDTKEMKHTKEMKGGGIKRRSKRRGKNKMKKTNKTNKTNKNSRKRGRNKRMSRKKRSKRSKKR